VLLAAVAVRWLAQPRDRAAPARMARLALRRPVRAVVVAPHPDDEVLGAGGLVARLVRRRQPVDVVFLTSGDGYLEAAGLAAETCPQDAWALRELAVVRQGEARTAATRLGLDPAHLHFLGFPDGDLPALWSTHWRQPLVSPRTGAAAPYTPGVVDPGATYTGRALVGLLAAVLATLQPTLVLVPDPRDTHDDHEHAAFFALRAIGSLPAPPRVLTYLVHDDCWPPTAEETRRLPPPSAERLADTRWLELRLTPAERAAKVAALDAHRTQLAAMPELLYRFLRPNELFGEVEPDALAALVPRPGTAPPPRRGAPCS